jgi:trigger factor
LDVKHEIHEGENWQRDLKVEVDADEVQSRFDEIYKQLRSEAKIPGFRPGKAPLSTIKTRFGDAAAQEVLEKLMEESFRKALRESGLDAISPPRIKDVDFGEGKPLIYTAQLEVRPEITLEKYTGFTLKRMDDRVSETEIQNMLEYLQRQNAELAAVERPAKEGDFVIADLEVIDETSGKLEEKNFTGVQIEMVSDGLPGQFLSALAGSQAGDVREFEVNYPADHFDKRFAGNKVRYRANIQAVKEMHLPELNEEFFRQFGDEINSVEDLREKLRENIAERKANDVKEALKEEAIKEVIDKNRFELPPSMVEQFLDNVVEDYRQRSKQEFDEKELRERYRALAIRQIRWNLLYHEIAKQEKIDVTQADLDAWLQKFADNYNITLEEARQEISKSRQIADLRETILESKVVDFIIESSEQETIPTPMTEPGDLAGSGRT